MQTPDDRSEAELEKKIDEIVAKGPTGAFAVAGLATFIVMAIVYLFYVFVYLPRGAVQ
jgi:hypothetical protein